MTLKPFSPVKFCGYLTLAACILSNAPGLAAEEVQSNLKLAIPTDTASKNKVETNGFVAFEGTQYQSKIPGKSKLDHSLSATVNLQVQAEGEKLQGRLDFTGEKFIDWGTSEWSVKELYGRYPGENFEVSAGRKLEFWSQGDQDWHLDLWQPNQTFDGLRPDQQGLTGIFFKREQGEIEILAMGSPVFIPTMGPSVKNDNGTLDSDSRWFRAPSSTFMLFDQERTVVYSLNVPHWEELVAKPGAGLRLRTRGYEKGGLWGAMGGAFKPMNQLLLKYDKKLDSTEEGEDTGAATLYPVVGYHSLFSADLGYKFSRSMLAVSYLSDQPVDVEQKTDDPYTIQHASPAKAYTFHADTEVDVAFLNNPLGLTFAYLRVDGGDLADYDAKGMYQGAVFTSRFQFTHAAMIRAEIQTDIKNKKLISRFKYLREFDQRGMIGSAEITYFPVKALGLTVGADMLGVDDASNDNTDDSFLNQFRANDRAYAGLSYVF